MRTGAFCREIRRMEVSYHGRLRHEQDGLAQLAQPSRGLAQPRISCRKTAPLF
ncbi:hypothetical protein SL1157_1902 [Ruegeria lacuscaerulensis ITI-1157]|nr:hypothetical protein SL1157_1902 [Ruegeria lacuscaerulensis ITI-1157]